MFHLQPSQDRNPRYLPDPFIPGYVSKYPFVKILPITSAGTPNISSHCFSLTLAKPKLFLHGLISIASNLGCNCEAPPRNAHDTLLGAFPL